MESYVFGLAAMCFASAKCLSQKENEPLSFSSMFFKTQGKNLKKMRANVIKIKPIFILAVSSQRHLSISSRVNFKQHFSF